MITNFHNDFAKAMDDIMEDNLSKERIKDMQVDKRLCGHTYSLLIRELVVNGNVVYMSSYGSPFNE